MNFSEKFKETCLTVLPITGLVCILAMTIAPVGKENLIAFIVGSALVILGLTFFLAGVDIGIMPAGSFIGSALTRTRNIPIILSGGFAVGFLITVAEPDLLVLSQQAEAVTGIIRISSMILAVSLGVGLCMALAMARTILQIPFRWIVIPSYILIFLLATGISPAVMAIAFDSGGATTGPMAVPFIIALGAGISGVRGDKNADDDSFGYTGIASIGPILAVLFLGFILSGNMNMKQISLQRPDVLVISASIYIHHLPGILKTVLISLAPLAAAIVVFQLVLLKLPPKQMQKIIIGIVYTVIGLTLFFLGAKTGFIPTGNVLGASLATAVPRCNYILLIVVGCILGAVTVCAEPAIRVLASQVEEISAGNIRQPVLLVALAMGVAVSVGLSLWRVVAGFSIWYLLAPCYAIALGLTFITPKLFTAIAFDSGGVASGPMASTFLLSLTLGASGAIGGNPATDAFGLIAMIAVTPLISIQILGILFRRKTDCFAGGN